MRFLLLVTCLLAMPAFAYADEISIGIPIRVVIIQCGTQQEAYEACESGTEQRCCQVVDPSMFELEEEQISSLETNKRPRQSYAAADSDTVF